MRVGQSHFGFRFGSLLGVVGLLLSPAARAADDSPALILFKEGRALATEGKYAEACPKFEESLQLEPGVGTQFNLADCWEHVGRLASAQKLFLGAAASAKAAGQADREQVLRERATALEPRVSKLVIEVTDENPRLTVKRDQLPLEPEQFGKAVAVDPGKYEIVAKAPGKKPWKKTVEISAKTPIVTVEVPALEASIPEPATAPDEAAAKAPPTKTQTAAPAAVTRPVSTPVNYKALGAGAFGVASLATGVFFAVRYRNANADAKDICPTSTRCSLAEITRHDMLVDRATTARSWMYAGIGVGTFSVAAAVALYALGTKPEPAHAWVRALPIVAENGQVGASVVGGF
jgi:tetratricopeptide (TPR) repeat protein